QRAERRASRWWNRPIVSLAAGVAIVVLALTLVSSLLPRGSSMSGSIVEGFLVGGAVIGVVGALIAIIVILRRR
ncbi:MAG: hypothetical protein NZM00_07265, partial [Anaerolinea sp.]|nr:hypothetical protein [Anaerolinea sp.]